MAEKTNQPTNFIGVMNRRTFERIIRGDYDYEQDMQTTEKYLEQAVKLNDPQLEAQIVNTRAVLNAICGKLDHATDLFWNLLAINEQTHNLDGMALAYNNLAVTSEVQGKYAEALVLYNRGLALFNTPEDSLREYGRLLTGKFSALVTLHHYDDADACFDEITEMGQALVAYDREQYARMMVTVYRDAAELALHRDDLEHAKKYKNLALEFANGLNLTFELATVHFTEAHYALKTHDSPDTYWDKGRDILQRLDAPALIGRAYIQEARYLQREGYAEESRAFTQLALALFEGLNLKDDIAIAHSLLA